MNDRFNGIDGRLEGIDDRLSLLQETNLEHHKSHENGASKSQATGIAAAVALVVAFIFRGGSLEISDEVLRHLRSTARASWLGALSSLAAVAIACYALVEALR